jgi:hypothetical protein
VNAFDSFKYTECAHQRKDGSFTKRRIIRLTDLHTIRKEEGSPLRSVWFYDSKETGRKIVDGKEVFYPTGRKLGNLHFDFDYAKNPDKARNDCLFILDKLHREYGLNLESVRIIFTGAKGFGLIVPYQCFLKEPRDDLKDVFKSFCKNIQGSAPTLDMSMYGERPLWKLEGSQHPKTGLFRIDLSFLDLQTLTLDEIKTLAGKGPRYLKYAPPVYTPGLAFFMRRIHEQKKKIVITRPVKEGKDFSGLSLEDRIPHKYRHRVNNGKRHNTSRSLIGTLTKAGCNPQDAAAIVRCHNSRYNNPPLPDDELNRLIKDLIGVKA